MKHRKRKGEKEMTYLRGKGGGELERRGMGKREVEKVEKQKVRNRRKRKGKRRKKVVYLRGEEEEK